MFETYSSPYRPLEGTVPAPRGFFVDRWGTLLETPEAGYASCAADVRFVPGALEALFRASRVGWKIYLLGNEDAVAFGKVTDAQWQEVEEAFLRGMSQEGIPIARNYVCLDHPEGVSGHTSDSVYMLPNTGAFYHATHTDGLDLGKSWVIGDSTLELVAGWRAGCRMASVRTGLALGDRAFHVDPELTAATITEVVCELLERQAAIHP